jgi:ribosome biogenesis protein ERB1
VVTIDLVAPKKIKKMLKRRKDEANEEDEFPTIEIGEESQSDEKSEEEEEKLESFEESRIRLIRKKALPTIEADYDSDTSDEEVHNTIGNIPVEWYDDFPHIGYDVSGKKIMRPAQGDDLDKFLSSMDDKNAW